jgi:phosphoglycolate phosphatase
MTVQRIDADQYDAILFDLDGTLIETDNRWAKQLADKLAPINKVLPRLDTVALSHALVTSIEMPGNYAISAVEHLGLGKHLHKLSDRVRRSKGLATQGDHEVVAGTLELIEALAGRFHLAVVTTRARREAHAFIDQLDLVRYFPVVITRQDVIRMKPNPEPLIKAAVLLGVSAERCIMVGDTSMDMRSARRAGALAVGVLSGFGTRREMVRGGAQIILETAAELLPLLSAEAASD